MSPRSFMSRRAFTLIELMVVIMIIATLAALANSAIGIAKSKAKQVQSQTVLSQAQAALDKYKTANGAYPEAPTQPLNPPAGYTPPSTSAWTTNFGSGTSIRKATDTSIDWKIINHDLMIHLHNTDPENFSVDLSNNSAPNYYLRDKFGTPDTSEVLRYRPARFYPFETGADKLIDSDNPPGSDSYQLWSCGKDATDNQGEYDSDDLTSWAKRKQ